jgi:hypothetical protein
VESLLLRHHGCGLHGYLRHRDGGQAHRTQQLQQARLRVAEIGESRFILLLRLIVVAILGFLILESVIPFRR